MHQFVSKRLQGIFVGYEQQAGGGWSGDLKIADWEQIENAESHSQINYKTFKAAEIEVVKTGDHFRYPLAEGVLRQPGSNNHKIRSLRLRRAKDDLAHDDGRPTEVEEDEPQEDTAEETSDSPAGGDTSEEKSDADFWSFPGDTLIIHHANARTKLFVPTDDNCPMPVKYLDVMRRTYTDLETRAENIINDLWTDEGEKSLSDSWTGKTVFYVLRPAGPPGYNWIEGRLTKIQQTSRPDSVWPEVWQSLSKKQKERPS